MAYREKVNIYVTERVLSTLQNDAALFEIYNKRGMINMNHFLDLLITGYYSTYIESCNEIIEGIMAELTQSKDDETKKRTLAENILKKVVLPYVPQRSKQRNAHVSFKPTERSEFIIEQLMMDNSDSLSQNLFRMFLSYCEKPLNERERIIFNEQYRMLKAAIENHRAVAFTTTGEDSNVHRAIPYAIDVSREEMFNYLLCQENNPDTGKSTARTFKLSHIAKLRYQGKTAIVSESIAQRLKRMQIYGCAYEINDDYEKCVRLTPKGVSNFKRIHFGRPMEDRIEGPDQNGNYLYYFKCSTNQVYLYFRKMDGKDAQIISPESERKRMYRFHARTAGIYEK